MATDVLGAVYQFCDQYLAPKPATIVRGWQNRAALPASSSLVILTLLDTIRHGTNARSWNMTPPAGIKTTVSMLTEYVVQVDICGLDEEIVNAQAALLLMLGRDPLAVEFFKVFNLQPYFADDIKSLPFSNELDQWVVRYSVTLHLGGWTQITVNQDAFSDVHVNIENVDVHHPPQE